MHYILTHGWEKLQALLNDIATIKIFHQCESDTPHNNCNFMYHGWFFDVRKNLLNNPISVARKVG